MSLSTLFYIFYIVSFSVFAPIFWATIIPTTMIELKDNKVIIKLIIIVPKMVWLISSFYLWYTDFVLPFVNTNNILPQMNVWRMLTAIMVVVYAIEGSMVMWQEYKKSKEVSQ